MTTCERLQQSLAEVKRAEQELRREFKAANRKRRRADLEETFCMDTSSEQHRRRMVLFFSLSQGDPQATVEMLRRSTVKPPWETWPHPRKVEFLNDLIMGTTMENLMDILDDPGVGAARARREGERLFAEYRTMQWTADLNSTRAIAPDTGSVVEHHHTLLPPFHEARQQNNQAKRAWAKRWRQRWAGGLGKIKAGHIDPPEILREKANGVLEVPLEPPPKSQTQTTRFAGFW